ncbi:MAG TPA: glycosyltransferase family 39 protein [Candidatus Moranbacteria bacterium]|jgi:uncharacterized membrane protein|nr:phospholipid carrier-dependent glycosyltransferase [Candidatus Moranbacteria bacterium]HPX94057.1 glycosyltransferase family 39 protein [Candidatus Moranbacteria bacterium]HQB59779.1 glycosyltransferase family 39 protein [Candidatus Moranbacteria bacterium]
MKKILEKYSLVIILLLATVLRLFQIGKRDFWFDEAFTGIVVKSSISDMFAVILKDVHPPLYYILAKAFSSFFNYNVIGLRLFSAIFGILAVSAVYIFAKELFNKKAAVWASLITAISPFAIEYSQEARMYSMLGFLIVIASYFFLRGLKTNRTAFFVLWGIFLGLAALTHYMGVIFAPIFYFIYIAWDFKKDSEEKTGVLSLAKRMLIKPKLFLGYFVSIVVFIPWMKVFIEQAVNGQNLSWITPVGLGDIFKNIQIFLLGNPAGDMSSGMPVPNQLHGVDSITALTLTAVLTCFVLFFLFKTYRNKREFIIICLLSFGFLILVYFFNLGGKYLFVSRYMIAGSYFLFVLLGLWLSIIKPKISYAVIAFYLLILTDIAWVQTSMGYNELYANRVKYEDNNIYFLNSFDYVIGKYYFGADKITLFNVDWPQYNPGDWSAIGPTLVRTEDFSVLKNDEKGLIIHNTQWPLDWRSDKTFEPDKFQLVDRYHNISVYKSNSYRE